MGGFCVEKAPAVGVAEAGNQTIVEVGDGVSVKMIGTGVAFNASNTEQEVVSNVKVKRKNVLVRRRYWMGELCPRDDINIMGI